MDVIEQFYQARDILYAVTVINNIIERINNLGTAESTSKCKITKGV